MVKSSHFSRLKTPKSLRQKRQKQQSKQQDTSTHKVFDLQIVELDEHGYGIGKSDCGQTFKVPYVLPGENCRAKGWAEGELLELLELTGPASSRRQPSACSSFGACGGCQLQHMPYDDQLQFKRERLWRALLEIIGDQSAQRHGDGLSHNESNRLLSKGAKLVKGLDQSSGLGKKTLLTQKSSSGQKSLLSQKQKRGQRQKLGQKPKLGQKSKQRQAAGKQSNPIILASTLKTLDDVGCLAHTSMAYRRRARLDISAQRRLGFRQARSNELVSIDNCPVLTQPLQEILQTLNQLFSEIPEVDWRSHIGHVELLDVEPQPLILVRLVKPIETVYFERVLTVIAAKKWRLGLQREKGGAYQMALGQGGSHYELHGQNISFEPGRFIQVNAYLNQAMVQQAVDWLTLDGSEYVLDLFCGVGNFSFALASKAKRVLGIELNQEMVEIARQNAIALNSDNVRFLAANLDLEGALLADQEALDVSKPDVILLDPPRAGAAGFIADLIELSPKKILYVSCHQGSLMRDLRPLGKAGYQLEKISIMDMFPNTEHVECMALLSLPK